MREPKFRPEDGRAREGFKGLNRSRWIEPKGRTRERPRGNRPGDKEAHRRRPLSLELKIRGKKEGSFIKDRSLMVRPISAKPSAYKQLEGHKRANRNGVSGQLGDAIRKGDVRNGEAGRSSRWSSGLLGATSNRKGISQ